MSNRLKLNEVAFALSTDYTPKLSNVLAKLLAIKFDGIVTASGSGAVSGLTLDCPANLLGTIQVLLDTTPIISARAVDLYHLDALLNSKYSQKLSPTPTTSATGAVSLNLGLMLGALGLDDDEVFLNAMGKELILRGKFGALVDYASTNVASITGTLRGAIETPDLKPGMRDYLRPYWAQKDIDIGTVSNNLQDSISFEKPTVLVGLLLRQFDTSAAADAQRTDGIIREIILREQTRAGGQEIYQARWGEIKQNTSKAFNIPLAEIAAGIGFILFPDNSNRYGFKIYQGNDKLNFKVDTSATVESDITAVSAAAGDLLVVTPIGFSIENL